jgi:hypothetical protein
MPLPQASMLASSHEEKSNYFFRLIWAVCQELADDKCSGSGNSKPFSLKSSRQAFTTFSS